jgi:hypothetical protein
MDMERRLFVASAFGVLPFMGFESIKELEAQTQGDDVEKQIANNVRALLGEITAPGTTVRGAHARSLSGNLRTLRAHGGARLDQRATRAVTQGVDHAGSVEAAAAEIATADFNSRLGVDAPPVHHTVTDYVGALQGWVAGRKLTRTLDEVSSHLEGWASHRDQQIGRNDNAQPLRLVDGDCNQQNLICWEIYALYTSSYYFAFVDPPMGAILFSAAAAMDAIMRMSGCPC